MLAGLHTWFRLLVVVRYRRNISQPRARPRRPFLLAPGDRAAVTPTSLPFGSGAARLVYPQDLSVIRQASFIEQYYCLLNMKIISKLGFCIGIIRGRLYDREFLINYVTLAGEPA